MARKIIIYFIVAFGVAMLVSALYLAFGRNEPPVSAGDGGATLQDRLQTGVSVSYPKGDFFELGTERGSVAVKNFYKTAKEIVDAEVVLAETPDYLIVYKPLEGNFDIFILSANNLHDLIQLAEEKLLEQLGISREDACKLNVAVYGANPAFGGDVRPLSFCPALR